MIWSDCDRCRMPGRQRRRASAAHRSDEKRVLPMLSRPGPRDISRRYAFNRAFAEFECLKCLIVPLICLTGCQTLHTVNIKTALLTCLKCERFARSFQVLLRWWAGSGKLKARGSSRVTICLARRVLPVLSDEIAMNRCRPIWSMT